MMNRMMIAISDVTRIADIGLNDMVSSSVKREQLMPFPLVLELLDT